jgi:hypothetical protein
MLIEALPLLSVVAAEAYVPLVRVTVPVGIGFPLPPLTVIATGNACAVVMLDAEGETPTWGAAVCGNRVSWTTDVCELLPLVPVTVT